MRRASVERSEHSTVWRVEAFAVRCIRCAKGLVPKGLVTEELVIIKV